MSLVLVRVDCRLIHGQVVETWVPHTGANCLVVANDDLVGNTFQRSVMEIAVPPDIHFSTLNIGNLHYAEGKVEIAPSVYFTREDFEALHCLSLQGVAVTVKATPFEAGTSFGPDR
jgi:mannose/fructose/N-acetylgalactosamine-specific phosphotransferase system component IIB